MLAVDRHGDYRAFRDGMIILMDLVFSLGHVRGTAGLTGLLKFRTAAKVTQSR
jgi:hypothetical protein